MTIQIDKGIPLPEKDVGRSLKYPFRDMEIGDSIQVSADNFSAARSAAQRRTNELGWTFASRKQADGSYRFWRTA